MKITNYDYQRLQAAITPLDTPERRAKYIAGEFKNAGKVTDLEKRYRWDLLWASKLTIAGGTTIHGDLNLYAYMDDEHIDTALRKIVPPLQ